jgi:hypothetical protein
MHRGTNYVSIDHSLEVNIPSLDLAEDNQQTGDHLKFKMKLPSRK